MIIINKPEIKLEKNNAILSCKIIENEENKEIWFSVDKKYSEFLVEEQLDAFLIAVLPYAMKTKQNIHVNGTLSERLYYTINNYLMKAISIALPYCEEIEIKCDSFNSNNLKCKGEVGTGYSAGVDSFATIYDNISDKTPKDYKITLFSYLNVGSHGDEGGDEARRLFNTRFENIRDYIDEVNIKAIKIDSNLSEFLKMKFVDTCTFRNIAAILAVQKLFKIYYFSSSVRLDKYELKFSSERYDLLNLYMLSTETTEFFSSGSQYTRCDKTRLISEYEPTYRYLDVCTTSVNNCSICEKCMRTQLTLDIFKKIELYNSVFDIKKYYENRNKYIAKVIINRKKNSLYKEIYDIIKTEKFEIPLQSYALTIPLRIKEIINNYRGR